MALSMVGHLAAKEWNVTDKMWQVNDYHADDLLYNCQMWGLYIDSKGDDMKFC